MFANSVILLSESEDAAVSKALAYAIKEFPPENGYFAPTAQANLVDVSIIIEAYQELGIEQNKAPPLD